MKTPKPKKDDMRIWWIPQIPGLEFHVSVSTPSEAKKIINVLADYDIFQFENKIKPDYCNAGGLEVFQSGQWLEWYDDKTGNGIDSFEVKP